MFHIAAVLVMCTPNPAAIQRTDWKAPSTQRDVRRWSGRLSSIGIDTSPEGLERWVRRRLATYVDVRHRVARIFDPYVNTLHLHQGWALFTNPQRNPTRVVVELHTPSVPGAVSGRAAGWTTLYVQRSEVFTWKREKLDNHRLRKLTGRIARRRRPVMYTRLATWMARAAAVEFPEADYLRVRLFRYRTHAPGAERRITDGRFTDERVFALARFR